MIRTLIQTKPVNPKDPNGQKYKDLKLKEDVKRTITYTYADDVADTTKRGAEAEPKYETTVSFTRTATVNGATGEITYSEWAAKDNDTTLEGKATVPVKPGYVAIGDVEASKKDVTGVNATDKDIVEKVIYKDLGKFVPVVPEGFTPPTIPKFTISKRSKRSNKTRNADNSDSSCTRNNTERSKWKSTETSRSK